MRRPYEKHGMRGTPIYCAWQNMTARSTPGTAAQKNVPSFVGINHDPRWDTFSLFYKDMGGTWFPGACLARYGDSGNYTKDNCRCVTKAQNARDRIKHFTTDGRPGVDAARENGIPINTYGVRVARGWSIDEAAGVVSR